MFTRLHAKVINIKTSRILKYDNISLVLSLSFSKTSPYHHRNMLVFKLYYESSLIQMPKRKLEGELMRVNNYWVPIQCSTETLRLAVTNASPRDTQIAFREDTHTYYVKGVADYTSCTTFVGCFFPKFDANNVAKTMISRADFGTAARYAKYQPCTKDEAGAPLSPAKVVHNILREWELLGARESEAGTRMHRAIELFYNNALTSKNPAQHTLEFSHFLAYDAMIKDKHWFPFRTEMIVWDKEFHICGSVDMLYVESKTVHEDWKTGGPPLRVHMVDWKRSKAIRFHGYGKTAHGPCAGLADCNHSKYSLQLNVYKYILEKHYNVHVESMALAVFHPNNPTYNTYPVRNLQPIVRAMTNSEIFSNKKTM